MPDNLIQITVKVDTKELQTNLQEGASTVQAQTDGMVSQFKKLAKESKTALDDVKKAAKLSGLEISDEVTSVLEQVPKLANGLASVFSGGGIGAFLGVLLQAGIALKGLYDDVIALKGAKEAWAELDKKFAASEDTLQAKMRQDIIEHIRLTQGSAAAAQAAIRMADKELVPLGKDLEQVLSGEHAGKLSKGLKKDLEGLQHITFGELPQKINDVEAAIQRADNNTKKLADRFMNFMGMAPMLGDIGRMISGYLGAAVEKAQGERNELEKEKKLLQDVKKEHDDDLANQKAAAAHVAAQEQLRAFQEGLEQQKEKLDAFHSMSKEAEAKYWDDIIALGKAKGENLKEIQHLRLEAQKEAQRQALQDEVEKVQDEVSAAKAGSRERVRLLDDEIQKMKAKRQDETQEYMRLVKERAQAEREFEDKSLRDEIEATQEKVAGTKAGSQDRVRILDQEIEKLGNEQKADTDEYKRLLKERETAFREYKQAEEAAEEAARKKTQEVQALKLQIAAQHTQALKGITQSQLDFERQIGLLGEAEYEERLRTEVTATYQAAVKELEAKRALYKQESVEYAKVEAEIVKLTDKYNADMEKAEEKSLLRRRQQFDQYFKQISSGFNTALNSWMQGSETASQAFGKMFQSILSQLVSFVEQWIEKKIEMWLMDALIGDQGSQAEKDAHVEADIAQILADAYTAAANAYAANAYDPITASAMAADAYATVSGFEAGASAQISAAGGLYQVPFDTVASIHKDEQVLPAHYAQGLRNLIAGNGGASGVTVVVNHSVNAIDAESFQGAIRRHGNMIGNEVARVLRKKGFSAA